jgi:hypothetical protein
MERIRLNETWVPIAGWEGLYEVSSLGHFRSCDRIVVKHYKDGDVLCPRKGGPVQVCYPTKGYPTVDLWKDNKATIVTVHTILAKAFKGPQPERTICRHLDDDPSNFALDNLAWGSHKDNCDDCLRNGGRVFGERNYNARLTEADVLDVRRAKAAGASWTELAERYKLPKSTLSSVLKQSWQHLKEPNAVENQ